MITSGMMVPSKVMLREPFCLVAANCAKPMPPAASSGPAVSPAWSRSGAMLQLKPQGAAEVAARINSPLQARSVNLRQRASCR
jgi:hypothetical protein